MTLNMPLVETNWNQRTTSTMFGEGPLEPPLEPPAPRPAAEEMSETDPRMAAAPAMPAVTQVTAGCSAVLPFLTLDWRQARVTPSSSVPLFFDFNSSLARPSRSGIVNAIAGI